MPAGAAMGAAGERIHAARTRPAAGAAMGPTMSPTTTTPCHRFRRVDRVGGELIED